MLNVFGHDQQHISAARDNRPGCLTIGRVPPTKSHHLPHIVSNITLFIYQRKTLRLENFRSYAEFTVAYKNILLTSSLNHQSNNFHTIIKLIGSKTNFLMFVPNCFFSTLRCCCNITRKRLDHFLVHAI